MMPELLSLSRAARLAGVTRADIQKQIRRGEMQTFEGQVAISDLLRVYPSVSLEHSGDFERVEQIKVDAIPRSHDEDTRLPSQEVLIGRIKSLAEALVHRVARVEALEGLLDEVGERLAERDRDTAEDVRALHVWLQQRRDALQDQGAESLEAQLLAKDTFLRIMSASVKMIPSGHEFFVDGTESILEAAVRSGLRLNYGCASGNCGECKARLMSGEVYRIRDHDYVLSEREKQMGYLLTCSTTAVTDVKLEAAEAHSPADLPEQEINAQVRKLELQADTLMQLHVQTPRTNTLRFMAGQRARLRLETGVERELPIASCPCNGRNLLFSVRRGADAFGEAVFETLSARQPITVIGPYGDFVLAEDATESAVFIAIDDGIAPVKSLVEHAVSIDSIEAFHLYWSISSSGMHYHEPWCRALRDSLDNFAFTPLIEAACTDLLALIESDLAAPDQARFYIAGPASAANSAANALQEAGIPDDRIALEPVD